MARRILNPDAIARVTELDLGVDDPDPDAVYYLRTLTTEKVRVIVKAHTTLKRNAKTHQFEEVIDHFGVADGIRDYVIARWEGVLDGDEPAPCTLTQKLLIPTDVATALLERAQQGTVTPEAKVASFREPA